MSRQNATRYTQTCDPGVRRPRPPSCGSSERGSKRTVVTSSNIRVPFRLSGGVVLRVPIVPPQEACGADDSKAEQSDLRESVPQDAVTQHFLTWRTHL